MQFEAQSALCQAFWFPEGGLFRRSEIFDLSFSSPNTIEMLRYFAGEESSRNFLWAPNTNACPGKLLPYVPRAYNIPGLLILRPDELIDLPDYFAAWWSAR